MRLTYKGEWDTIGLNITDVLTLPDSQRDLITRLMREEMMGKEMISLAEAAAYTGQDEVAARTTLDVLAAQGFIREVEVDGETRYQLRLASKRGRHLSANVRRILDKEFGTLGVGPDGQLTGVHAIVHRVKEVLLSKYGRFVLSVSPLVAIFLLTEWFFLTGTESFTGPLSFTGTITATLIGGIFPVLILVASRRKGEFVPAVVFRLLGHPVFITVLSLLFLTGIFLHGLVIWNNVVRSLALLILLKYFKFLINSCIFKDLHEILLMF